LSKEAPSVVITGASGFLGSHLVREFARRGYRVTAIMRPSSSPDRIRDVSGLHVVDTAKLDPPTLFKGVAAVVHAATCYGRNGETAAEILAANVDFPVSVMEGAALAGVPVFVNTDSYYTKDGSNSSFLTSYSLSKRQFVEWGRELANRYRMRFINMRLEHLYGEGDSASKFVPALVRQCAGGVPEIPLTSGEQQRDFIHVRDAVAAFVRVLEVQSGSDPLLTEYEVGCGTSIALREFVTLLNRLSGNRTRLMFGALPYRKDEIMSSKADIDALKRLGWSPGVSLEEGLSSLVAEARSQSVQR